MKKKKKKKKEKEKRKKKKEKEKEKEKRKKKKKRKETKKKKKKRKKKRKEKEKEKEEERKKRKEKKRMAGFYIIAEVIRSQSSLFFQIDSCFWQVYPIIQRLISWQREFLHKLALDRPHSVNLKKEILKRKKRKRQVRNVR